MKKAITLLAASFAALAAVPTVNANSSPEAVQLQARSFPFDYLGSSMVDAIKIRSLVSRRSMLGGIFRPLNQRQRRKLHRQVPQLLRKK